jgi:signal transduction histidine kinase
VENAIEKANLLRTIAEQREELEVFSRVLVHDLKSPISNMLSMAVRIEDGIRDGIQGGGMEGVPSGRLEKMVRDCRHLRKSAKRTEALIDTLYDYTTSESEVLLKPSSMGEVIVDALSNLEPIIRDRGARVTYDELPTVNGSLQLIQLMQNLIGNGIKYCDEEVPVVHVSAIWLGKDLWQFTVKDNGIGIPEEFYRQIFEPFQRLHGDGKYEGTGLGLATCKKIVERHGGTISCASKEGLGTTFYFTLHGAEAEGKIENPTLAVEVR